MAFNDIGAAHFRPRTENRSCFDPPYDPKTNPPGLAHPFIDEPDDGRYIMLKHLKGNLYQ